MTGTPSAPPQPAGDPPLARLSRRQFWFCLAVPVAAFLFLTGPIWSHPWDIDRIDAAIWYSYLPLPVLVAACLVWSRRFTVRAFLLELLNLTLIKYTITFSFALVLWSRSEPPPKLAALRAFRGAAAAVEPPPAPTPMAPDTTGALRGVITGPGGRPVAGALVLVDQGLEGLVFAPPEAPLLLENDGAGVKPRVAAAQTYQTISARSTDGRLHTLVAGSAGGPLFNVPLLSSGLRSDVVVREPHGVARIRCAVHQGDVEHASWLAVVPHPFFATTAEDGRFAWAGVPRGKLRVTAWHPELGEASARAELAAGGAAELVIALEAAK